MADVASVEAARKRVSRTYSRWLKEKFNRKMSELGRDMKRSQLPAIIPGTGIWREGNKPPAWIVHFSPNGEGWIADAPTTRFSGTLNMQAQTDFQGIYFRIIPLVAGDEGWQPHSYWEWTMAFVFPGLPTAWMGGSTGTVLDLDPRTGALTAVIGGVNCRQDYVDASLFSLLENPDEQWGGDIKLSYGEATEALARFINVECVEPVPIAEPD